MLIKSGSQWLAQGQRTEHVEFAVAERVEQFTETERATFIGRLVNILAEKGVITVKEAGELFYEDWGRC